MAILEPCDIQLHRASNTAIPYLFSYKSCEPGPHALITALVHGNELCGAHAVKQLLAASVRPTRGTLSFCFVNVTAYHQFNSADPFSSRYVDEDLNRVWSTNVLDGSRDSVELSRARALRPVLDTVDDLLDIHSTATTTPPMLLIGLHKKGEKLARKMGNPKFCVVDEGHATGTRLRDYSGFGLAHDPRRAILVECGQHLSEESTHIAVDASLRFLIACGTIDALPTGFQLQRPSSQQRLIKVTEAVTIETDHFKFQGNPRCFDCVPTSSSVIAYDGRKPIRTPYDNCVLVMPTQNPLRGQTAVRLGYFADWDN